MEQNNSTDQLKVLGYDSVKEQNNTLSLKNNQLESKLLVSTNILREIKLNVEWHGSYYIEDDSDLMGDVNKFLSDEG